MSTLVLGDLHIKAKKILPLADSFLASRPDINRVVFCGDYTDDWTPSRDEFVSDIEYLVSWVESHRLSGMQVDLVFGNHDFQYLIGVKGPGTRTSLTSFVRNTLFPLNLRMATVVDGYLVTHGGLTQAWYEHFLDYPLPDAEAIANQLNSMLDSQNSRSLMFFDMCGYARGGFEIPSPIWADKVELVADPADGVNQIVGHTPVGTAHMAEAALDKHGVELWFCDTFSTSSYHRNLGDYTALVVDDRRVEVVHLTD